MPLPRGRFQLTVNVVLQYMSTVSGSLSSSFELVTIDVAIPQNCLLQQLQERVLRSLSYPKSLQGYDLVFLKATCNPVTKLITVPSLSLIHV